MSLQPRVFTFYSYKGGVGRSMALLNMAYYLHARGRHVLIVDLDLDAPGASGFLQRNDELLHENGKRDVIDILGAVVETARTVSTESDAPLPPLPPLRFEAFLRSVRSEKYAEPALANAPRSRFDVLVADMDRDYTSRLSALALPSLSADQIAIASDLLRGIILKHRFPFHQPWQEEGEAPLPTAYDYILVDSRTGLSEIGGLCVGPLSDRLIVLCGLNDQNIAGTKHFLSIIGLEPKPRPANAPAWDDDDKIEPSVPRSATLGPKPTLLVASPVPGGEMTYKKVRMAALQTAIGIAPVKLSYHPQMALMETIFVRDYPDEYLALEYTAMANRVMEMVGDASEQHKERTWRIFGPNRSLEETKRELTELPQRLVRLALESSSVDFPIPARALLQWGATPEVVNQVWRLQISLAPSNERRAEVWMEWAESLDSNQARSEGNSKVFLLMDGMYRNATELSPGLSVAFHQWGIALSNWAKMKTGADADALFTRASEKFQRANAIAPNDSDVWSDIACLAGLRGDVDEAVSALERWKALNAEPTQSDIDEETDFDRVRDNPRFRAFRDSLPD